MVKKVKAVNRDKYWALAKEQGYRSRAAFKLIQINKKHDFLSKARVCIDLCAAPGGWSQVAAKVMPANSVVIGVDLLPIRPIRNVKTFVADITTAECRSLIKKEVPPGWQADVVLCDGAPNLGAAYVKDAFVQNELALAALKTATDHLGKGGTFCTKVYRSQDYNALLWVFKQLFEEVEAIKPTSSRMQSAEIFVLCTKYKCPASLDPRLLDPAHVFKQVEVDEPDKRPSIFDKAYGLQKRHRTGYSDSLGQTLRRKAGVAEFVDCAEPGQFLADFDEILTDDPHASAGDKELQALYWAHSTTSAEVRSCCADLRVLNKGDFRTLLKWRLGLRDFRNELRKTQREARKARGEPEPEEEFGGGSGDEAAQEAERNGSVVRVGDLTEREGFEGESEEAIMAELEARREDARMKVRREKKKERAGMAKLRERKMYGMDHNSFEVAQDDAVFKLTSIKDKAHLDAASSVALGSIADGADLEVEGPGRRKRFDVEVDEYGSDLDEEDRDALLNQKVEGMLEESYTRYLGRRKEPELRGTKSHKRSKKLVRDKAMALASEDAAEWDGADDAYVKLLTGSTGGDVSSDDDDEEDDDGFHAGPRSYKEGMAAIAAKRAGKGAKAAKAGKKHVAGAHQFDDDFTDEDDEEKEEGGGEEGVAAGNEDSDDESGYVGVRQAKRAKAGAKGEAKGVAAGKKAAHPLLVKLEAPPEAPSAAASRWFSDAVFDDVLHGPSASSASEVKALPRGKAGKAARQGEANAAAALAAEKAAAGAGSSDESEASAEEDDDDQRGKLGLDGMPLTDKQLRSLKRKKNEERLGRQKKRKDAKLEKLPGLEFVNGEDGSSGRAGGARAKGRSSAAGISGSGVGVLNDDDDEAEAAELLEAGLDNMPEAQRQRVIKARLAIKAGVGSGEGFAAATKGGKKTKGGAAAEGGIEFVPAGAGPGMMPPRKDDRTFGSDSEDYDSDDQATTLALGTLMLRKSRAKKIVDASYNRYAWNDPSDLPEWFADDEAKHYKPQLPIPKSLMDSIKQRFQDLTSKPIKKVAEARARKRKRSADKLKAAKKKAEALSNAPDMSEKEKLKAIGKAINSASKGAGTGKDYVPTKKLVIARKAFKGKPPPGSIGKSFKMVDKRLKNDTRAAKRKEQNKKKGGKKRKGKGASDQS